jgi:murein DD-endopeptidase MepM/ murein hydrolase activator NlpD
MLNKPKLVKSQSPVQKQLNSNQHGKENASFIMGLNNRVAKLDARMGRIEAHIVNLHNKQIGYRELLMTLVLAVLIFTSVILAIRELLPSGQYSNVEQRLLSLVSNGSDPEKKLALNLLSNSKATHPLTNLTLSQSFTEPNNPPKYHWPLERHSNSSKIQYSKHKHGIHITAKLGDPVVAIAQGKVLYSGHAINGYGNLILIQHTNQVISVYGNNYSNYTHEGQTVSQGELIAAAGEAEGHSAKLYFEIRFKGKAEDPFLYFNQAQ